MIYALLLLTLAVAVGALVLGAELYALRQTVRGLRSDVDTLAEYLLRCVTTCEHVAKVLDEAEERRGRWAAQKRANRAAMNEAAKGSRA